MARKYPHLLPDDIKVWERFLHHFGNDYTHFDYDVRVGYGRDPGPGYDSTMRQMGVDLSQRRIDAVGHRVDRLDIIEITHSAGLTAVGQLLSYPILYGHMFQPRIPLIPLLVCAEIQSDIEKPLTDLHIPYYIV
jgi:hypothetical protein